MAFVEGFEKESDSLKEQNAKEGAPDQGDDALRGGLTGRAGAGSDSVTGAPRCHRARSKFVRGGGKQDRRRASRFG